MSGAYSCADEGVYTLNLYSAASDSGYAFRYNGLETGTTEAFSDHLGPFGSCGLYLQLTAGALYHNSVCDHHYSEF